MGRVVCVDLDRTLAEYHGWQPDGGIGKPIPLMVLRVLQHIKAGDDVRIFTARASASGRFSLASGKHADIEFVEDQIDKIQKWCQTHLGMVLPITCMKDLDVDLIYDDIAVQVIPNTGLIVERA